MLLYYPLELPKIKPVSLLSVVILECVIHKLVYQFTDIGTLHRVILIINVECYLRVYREGRVVIHIWLLLSFIIG